MLTVSSSTPLILIVEDDDSHAELIRRSFESLPEEYRLHVAGCLHDARKVVDIHPPGLVLTDYRLPDGDGRDLVKMVNEACPVIMMTSHGNEQVAVDAMKSGVQDYVVKSEEVFSAMPCIAQRALREWALIQERKRAQELLHKREQEFRALVENAPDPIVRYDRDGRRIYVNPTFERLFGKPASQLLGKTSAEISLGNQSVGTLAHQAICRALNNGVATEVELAWEDGYCTEHCYQFRFAPEFDREGIVTSVLSVGRDITDRKRAMEILRDTEITLRGFLENMPAGCMWTNADGKIEYVNKYFVELTGYTLDEISTLQALFERIYPDPVQRERIHAAHAGAFFKTKKTVEPCLSKETRITRKDGSVRHVIINAHPVGTRMLAVFTDVTEREQIRNELLKAKSLESLGVLAGGIAHDFNNILTGVIGHISIAQNSLDTTSQAHESMEIAKAASLRATALTRRLITFAKGDALVKSNVSVRCLANESFSLALHGSNVQGVVHIPDTLHDIEADEGQISQAFNNIVINAVQSMPNGGTLTVQADNADPDECEVIGLSPGTYIRISFTDEGGGISEEDQKRIFDPYFTTKPSGTGLGLASCHSIVTKHGGRIVVSSTVGVGTTFTIYLPSLGRPFREHVGEPAKPGGQAGGTVLVMDDEQAIREYLMAVLSHIGYRATDCVDGREAVSLYKAAKEAGSAFDVVILDLNVPNGMGGRDVASHILEYDPTALLIASSGYSDDPVMANHAKYGFRAVLPKPYTIDQLARLLKSEA